MPLIESMGKNIKGEMYMKNGAFYLGNMTDADLENLYLSAQTERIRRR